jgi:hypothetical protein
MIFAELIVIAVLGLKSVAGSAVLMIPLPILTILVYRYLDQKHYKTAVYLQLKDSVLADKENSDGLAGDCARRQYLQPALQSLKIDTGMATVMPSFQGRPPLPGELASVLKSLHGRPPLPAPTSRVTRIKDAEFPPDWRMTSSKLKGPGGQGR